MPPVFSEIQTDYPALGYQLAKQILNQPAPYVIICENSLQASQLAAECAFFIQNQCPVLTFPDWETLPYDTLSPHEDIISERLQILSQAWQLKHGAVFIHAATLMHRLPPRSFILTNTLQLKVGGSLILNEFRENLQRAGYQATSQVYHHGEYATRGSIIDLFPMGSTKPVRMDLFDNEIDSLRYFDTETQRSLDTLTEINLLPAHEFLLDAPHIEQFRSAFRAKFPGDPMRCRIYDAISRGIPPAGIEYYIPLFYQQTSSFFDFFPAHTQVIKINHVAAACDHYIEKFEARYEQYRHNPSQPILPPLEILFSTSEILHRANDYVGTHYKITKRLPDDMQALPPLTLSTRSKEPFAPLQTFLSAHTELKVVFCAETKGRREALHELLSPLSLTPQTLDWLDLIQAPPGVYLTVCPLQKGFVLSTERIAFITEYDLLQEYTSQRETSRSKTPQKEWAIRNLVELNVGDPVVHETHGIGLYQGLTTLTIDGIASEFLVLTYDNNDKIYVPIAKISDISRYTGVDKDHIALTRLGSKQWDNAKRKAMEKIRDTAAELLEMYAERAAQVGLSHQKPDAQYVAFARSFAFEETPDQAKTIQEVIHDMTSPRPMDRLVCGDVGFGKTEIAMRAAFIAVHSGYQVAVLAPTTLLEHQHFESFRNRFADFPVLIKSISRFSSDKDKKTILQETQEGKVDILIGTHLLLNHMKSFKNLGLIIIDEEHRFGVSQKEKLKAIRANIDVLTLTATPIPRTLNMAMHALRDLSIIASPPKKRLSIKTFVQSFDEFTVKEAVLREILRGGQVYYLHNQIKTIEKTAAMIQRWIPEAKVHFAHGQMREHELERIMSDFYHQRFNVLVSTTIIETGIDIPSANTIIIESADMFGLAQLHQLRGRVGRSHHQAYAYLLLSPDKTLTTEAEKRLEAIARLSDLGAGFMLATNDLEIRGAGEILGQEQSGHMQAIGFTLYTELLERAVNTIKAGKTLPANLEKPAEIEINLKIPALIPDSYLGDPHIRLIFYKRISTCHNQEELKELQVEMIDRFGLLPEPLKNLFACAELKLRAAHLGIVKIELGEKGGYFEFNENPQLNTHFLLELIQKQAACYRLKGQRFLQCTVQLPAETRLAWTAQMIERLQPPESNLS